MSDNIQTVKQMAESLKECPPATECSWPFSALRRISAKHFYECDFRSGLANFSEELDIYAEDMGFQVKSEADYLNEIFTVTRLANVAPQSAPNPARQKALPLRPVVESVADIVIAVQATTAGTLTTWPIAEFAGIAEKLRFKSARDLGITVEERCRADGFTAKYEEYPELNATGFMRHLDLPVSVPIIPGLKARPAGGHESAWLTPEPEKPKRQAWEYGVIKGQANKSGSPALFEALDARGLEGWEMCGIFPHGTGDNPFSLTIFLKRPKEG